MTNDEMSEAPERIFAAMIDGELKASVNPIRSPFAREYIRADLLPVVKPLEWDRADLGVWGEYAETGIGRYALTWDFGDGPNGEQTKFKIRLNGNVIHNAWHFEAPYHIAQADYEARIRASLDMIDLDALVAGAYEAAIRACINMGLLTDHPNDAGSTVLRALTPADAQAALDAAIAKAVNEKLDEAAKAVAPMTIKIAGTPYQAGCGQIADAILAMKETE